jgi:cytochrome b subunit of formate dehydrogenase
MFGAGAFVFILPVLAITWGLPNRFGRRAVREDESGDRDARFFWLPKLMFWLLLVSGLAVCLTMLLSMLPIFGTEGLEILLDIHRYTGLLAVVALAIHLYCMVIQRFGLR